MRRRSVLSAVALVAAVASVSPPAAAVEVVPDGASYAPAVSADGRWVAFISEATNLLAGEPAADPNGVADVFLVDTQTATIRLVSSAAGQAANGESTDVDISADGAVRRLRDRRDEPLPGRRERG